MPRLRFRVDIYLGDFRTGRFYPKRIRSYFATDSVQNQFFVGYVDLAQRLEDALAAAATAANTGSAPAALAATQAATQTNAVLPPATAPKANLVLPQDVA